MLSKFLNKRSRANDRRTGNQCRNAHDWVGASAAYARHLVVNRTDQPIWVQLGHAYKEQGLLTEAANAYQAAVDLDSRDADASIHLADVLRRLGRGEDALAAYERVNDIAPNVESMQQIRLLRRDTKAIEALGLGEGTTFFAIQDLFGYLKAHVTMSGIQRVQAGIAMHAIRDTDIDVRFILSNVGPETPALPAGEFWMVDNAEMMRAIDYASGRQVDHETLRAMLMACEDAAERVRPLEGSTIILLGAFWGLGNSIQNFVRSKRDGVRIGAYVYDIIPVTHPEFCDDALVTDFTMAICELCGTADFVLTISDATRIALTDFITENGGRPIPMTTVPLAHHLTREAGHSVAWPEQLRRVKGKPYVAYVSTIEGRKNHLYVINAWRRLIAEGVDVPDLVFVGRHGWKIGALTDVLTATENLGGRLHIAHNLSDGELNAVYAGCEFSVFTSFVEGWGLPVGESLFHGRPCIASNTSSIPEVGGDLVDYVDPFNLTQGVKVFRRMITDRGYLRSRVEAIRDRFIARTWNDVGADFLEKIKLHQDTPITPFTATLKEGENFSFQVYPGDRVDTHRYFQRLNRLLAESAFFYAAEDHGIWMRGANPELSIATDMAAGTSLLVYLKLSIAPGALECRLKISDIASDTETASIGLHDLRHAGGAIRMPAVVGKDGALHLRFNVIGSYSQLPGEVRNYAIGLRSIGYAQVDNTLARQELIEAMTLQDLAA
ncbi:glycosyltransferase family 4 protein [Sphingomonas sp. BAUL-RG-20F-R05-02]|uniref:glycosyltransferase family 4 protein n=1 Tax=Sphingomonas sp. BAUL-RG-20F-R05-02 TaxID=2914830 RepID=UPI001F5797D5|nr:glycosyltransferase [Sphingomonas sp. BAUL-RG-20F-R05-02]